jgi:hypothetical protein
MTGTKKDREALKNRYRKGMYPTENDFADVFESYVHKDDDIPMSKVVITDGDGKPTTLSGEIDKKADKTTLQTFIDETETILQVVRNDNNQIASNAIDNLLSRIQAAEDDIDTAEDNISGHETRIVTLESSKTDYEAFKERVRAFLEDADASDATINRWHEIETFLQGITDTETLTGLLNDLKNEILAAIPSPQSGNFIEYTTDLDAITDAPNGKIMQYWGQSNDKYKRGQFYERVEKTSQATHVSLTNQSGAENVPSEYFSLYYTGETIKLPLYDPTMYIISEGTIKSGDIIWWSASNLCEEIQSVSDTSIVGSQHTIPLSDYLRDETFCVYKTVEGHLVYSMTLPYDIPNQAFYCPSLEKAFHATMNVEGQTEIDSSIWQHLHVDEIIN